MDDLPLTTVFDGLPDPRRQTRNELHRLTDILVIATCAVIGGAESWEAIAEYGRTKAEFFRRFLPVAFAQAFGRWMAAACEAAGLIPVAIDGKSARAARRNTATGCLHGVTAWAAENRLVLGTASVADGSNEIAAIPELLRVLDLAGAIVTIDAAGCQVENARIIREKKGHNLLTVKDNQPTLRAAIEAVFDRACEADFVGVRTDGHEEVEDGHGRHEECYVSVVHASEGLPSEWPDVAAVVQVNREREVGGVPTTTSHDDLSSHGGRQRSSPPESGATGGSRTGCTGDSTWWSGTTAAGSGRSTPGEPGADPSRGGVAAEACARPGQGSGVTKRLKAGWNDNYLL